MVTSLGADVTLDYTSTDLDHALYKLRGCARTFTFVILTIYATPRPKGKTMNISCHCVAVLINRRAQNSVSLWHSYSEAN